MGGYVAINVPVRGRTCTGAGSKLPADADADAGEDAAGLAVVAHVVEVVRDGLARGETLVPGAQRGEGGEVGQCGGQGSGRSGGGSVP